MNEADYHSRLTHFKVLRNKFDQFLFNYGPTLLLLQFCITALIFLLASENPFGPRYTLRWVEVVFFLFALIVLIIEAYVTRDFFENIPRTFQEIVERKAIKGLNENSVTAQNLISFLNEFENTLNNRAPLILGVIFEIIVLIANQRALLFPVIFLPENYPIGALILNFFTIFLPMTIAGYAMSVVVWKCFVTGYFVHKFSRIFDLSVSPSHPDKAGGLKPLGGLIFSLALILIVASLALSILTVAGPINEAIYRSLVNVYSPTYQVIAPYDLYSTVLVAKVALGIVMVLSFVSFLLPLTSTHRRMRNEKILLLSSLTGIGNKIADLETQSKKIDLDYKVRNNIFEEIDSLSRIYDRTNKTPVWPFDREILIRFFTPQVISLLSLIGVVQPIIDAISSWVS
jgi:hypothetical protein